MQKKLDKTNKNGFVETTNRKIKIIEQRRARQTLIPSRDTVHTRAWVVVYADAGSEQIEFITFLTKFERQTARG